MMSFRSVVVIVSAVCSQVDLLSQDENWSSRVASLISILNDGRTTEKIRAAEALANIGTKAETAVRSLIHAADDSDLFVMRWAVYSLGKIGPSAKDALPLLTRKLTDQDFALRTLAAFALCEISPQDAPTALPVLTDALWNPNPQVQTQAACLIGKMGNAATEAVPYLVVVLHYNAIDGPRTWHTMPLVIIPPVKSKQEEQLPVTFILPQAAHHTSTENVIVRRSDFMGTESSSNAARKAALIALGRIGRGARGAVPFVEAATYDADEEIRRTAKKTLDAISNG